MVWMVCLQPKHNTKNPNVNVPTMPPKLFVEANHESSSILMGPVSNGVSYDIKTSVAGDIHPFICDQTTFYTFLAIEKLRVNVNEPTDQSLFHGS